MTRCLLPHGTIFPSLWYQSAPSPPTFTSNQIAPNGSSNPNGLKLCLKPRLLQNLLLAAENWAHVFFFRSSRLNLSRNKSYLAAFVMFSSVRHFFFAKITFVVDKNNTVAGGNRRRGA